MHATAYNACHQCQATAAARILYSSGLRVAIRCLPPAPALYLPTIFLVPYFLLFKLISAQPVMKPVVMKNKTHTYTHKGTRRTT